MIEKLLQNKTAKERANIKGQEIAKGFLCGKYTNQKYGVKIDIQSIKAIEGGVEILARAWKGTRKIGFGKDGTIDLERFRIFNPPILVDDPNGTIIRPYKDAVTGEPRERKLREDPKEAILQSLAHIISLVGKDGANIVKGKVGNTTSTFYPDADPETTSVDGTQRRRGVDETWATIRGGAATAGEDAATDIPTLAQGSTTTNQWAGLDRGFFLFDTSAIPDGDTIDSATISLYGKAGGGTALTVTGNIYSSSPASNTAIVAGDFGLVGTTQFSTGIAIGSWSITAYNNYALNASGLAAIDKTGVSKFSHCLQEDRANSAPSWVSGATGDLRTKAAEAVAGTTEDPKLVVEHSVPVTFVLKTMTMLGVGK